MAKMNKKWVVLCSTAIAAVYAAGYWTTEIDNPNMLANTAFSSPHVSGSTSETSRTSESATAQVSDSNSQVSSKYNDGTYTGMGSNRRGMIQVTVAIKSDRITDVEISDFAMHYSIDDVVGMPDEVLNIQNANVENVSGATYSTRAFSDAVQDALNQALRA
ncbi:FMN-binding protein [Paenibacillus rhizovicinus]|uniref:FMN-binding protein n=1 Tax=Paenibacillus rhizovicinus TaxID=2704463 RepID=A0A6C0NTB2_9BACL|nr:FMN-binding protein [Paenibacillus rhizovicinus]QHW29434.1 FMN-binding protein [Paenibacillus rhizovicinus]